MYATISELRMDDVVEPLSRDPRESGKTFTVTDMHPMKIGGEYVTVAVTLWDGWREFTSRTSGYRVVSRRWD